MRLSEKTHFKEITRFLESGSSDAIVTIKPTSGRRKKIRKKYGKDIPHEIQIRLIRVQNGKSSYLFATDMLESSITPESFSNLYRERWGIEELFKVSKVHLELEEFHSKNER